MAATRQLRTLISGHSAGAATATLVVVVAFVLTIAASPAAQAQSYKKIHDFTGGQDGSTPEAGVTLDVAGNVYGTTYYGGAGGCGTVYELKAKGGGWVFNPLLSFNCGGQGANPQGRVVFGPNGVLYGTTGYGGIAYGIVFKLAPSPRACTTSLCPWTETVLYTFTGGGCDGAYVSSGDPYFDKAGNIYGITYNGGCYGAGAVFELTPPGTWGTEHTLYSFQGPPDGANSTGGVISNDDGAHFFGVTEHGGTSHNCSGGGGFSGCGTVFELTQVMGYQYTEGLLHSFANGSDGSYSITGLTFDGSDNLFGATSNGGSGGGGVVFELPFSSGWMTLNPIYSFTGTASGGCPALAGYEGPGPWKSLAIDTNANLYGTTACDGKGYGNVFQLILSNGNYIYNDLYDFCPLGPPCSDGAYPSSEVTLHYNMNGVVDALYGTASAGGSQGVGVAWELTP